MNITYKQYKTTDIAVLSLIGFVLEGINLFVFNRFFPSALFVLSLTLPVSLILMQRWGAYAAVCAAVCGLSECIFTLGAQPSNYVIYIAGNLFILLNLLWYKLLGKSKITESPLFTVLFTLTGYLEIALGRATAACLFGADFALSFPAFLAGDALNTAIAIVILLIARRQVGLFEDQKAYLFRIDAEKRKANNDR